MATYKTTKNGVELKAKVGNMIFNFMLCKSPTTLNFDNAQTIVKMLTDGKDESKCKAAGIKAGKDADVYECFENDSVIVKATRGEILTYASKVLVCKPAFDSLNALWLDARPEKPAFMVGKLASKGSGDSKSVDMIA